MNDPDPDFRAAVTGLLAGDFSRLAPLFDDPPANAGPCPIAAWLERGWFKTEPAALEEALTCACFLGRAPLVALLLDRGVDIRAGGATGLNGFHWAANRGQLETVRLLIARKAPLEVRNMYGGSVLGTAVWSAIHEPRPDHEVVIEALVAAGARLAGADFPTGDARVDGILRRLGAA